MSVTVSSQDVTDAENFLEEFMSDKIPAGDYTEGSALRDLAIKAISFVVAYLRKTDTQIRARQSLLAVSTIDTTDDAEATDDAVDQILSNWFGTRKAGTFSRVLAYAHASQRTDFTIPKTAVFYRDAATPFYLDSTEDLFVPAESLTPIFDVSGAVVDYTFSFPLVAQQQGDFNINPGVFSAFTPFSLYVTKIETLEKATGGTGVETTDAFIERSRNLVTVRNLINERSCDAVLRDTYGEIQSLTTVGMGDTEMIRDHVTEFATGLQLHVGGHMDIFVNTPVAPTSFSGVVGGRFARPDGVINVFRDDTYTALTTFTAAGVTVGMVLHITAGFATTARDYAIREVLDTELRVSERIPFPVATDENNPATYVTWSVGRTAPGFTDVITTQTTGQTSRQVATSGCVVLPGGPLYLVKDVSIYDPSDPDADPADQRVHFYVRTNAAPTDQAAPDNEYRIVVHNPECHQSKRSYAEVQVLAKYDGMRLDIAYDTLAAFGSIDDYVSNRYQRIGCDNSLVRGFHPAYVSLNLEYNLKKNATEPVDETEAVGLLVEYINTFDNTKENLDVSTISSFFKAAYPQVSNVFPFTLYYSVHVPDGRVVEFASTEAVSVPSDLTALQELEVYPGDDVNGLDNPLDYGVSDTTVRYLTTTSLIRVSQRS